MTTTAVPLANVLVAVKDLLDAVGETRTGINLGGVDLLIGEKHLPEFNNPPRVVLVPTKDGGKVGPVLNVGNGEQGSITESVVCYIWGAPAAGDQDRYDDATARAVRLFNAFKATCAGGRLTGTKLTRGDASVQTYGEEYQLALTYTWAIPTDDEIWAAAQAAAPSPAASPEDPDRPAGDTGLTIEIDHSITNAGT